MRPFPVRALDGVAFHGLLPWRVARELRDFKPTVVLVQGAHEAALVLLGRALARSHVPVVLDVHGDWRTATRLYGSPARRFLNPAADRVAAWAVRHVDAIRTVSDFTTRLVRELGMEPASTFPAFMDLEPFLTPPLPLPSRPRALFVGVLELYKGLDLLAEAWPLVGREVPDAELRLIGSGSRSDLVRRMIARGPNVTWDSGLEPAEVAAELDRATCLVLPSRREGMGRVVVEAFCRGRGVVGTRGGGIEDLVQDGENGLLVPPDDVGALAAALVRMLTDSELAERTRVQREGGIGTLVCDTRRIRLASADARRRECWEVNRNPHPVRGPHAVPLAARQNLQAEVRCARAGLRGARPRNGGR